MTRRKGRWDKNSTKRLQDKTVKNAYRQGLAWDDDEVSALVNGIQDDKTTFDIAMSIGRTYYGVMSARSHVGFALRHASALYGPIRNEAVGNKRKGKPVR